MVYVWLGSVLARFVAYFRTYLYNYRYSVSKSTQTDFFAKTKSTKWGFLQTKCKTHFAKWVDLTHSFKHQAKGIPAMEAMWQQS